MGQDRIVIVGGGFAGVWAAFGAASLLKARAAQGSAEITLVSPGKNLVIRPRLYESDLSGTLVPLGGVLGPLGIDHCDATVESIDSGRRELTLSSELRRDRLAYDQLLLCVGSRLQLPGVSGRVHCVDNHQQAVELQRAIASLGDRPDARFTANVLGAGFTGLELAAELADVLRAAARAAGAAPPRVPVHLVDLADTVAPEFGPKARAVIEKALDSLGIESHTGVAMSDVDDAGAVLANGKRLDADLTVWAGGPRASALNQQLGLPLDSLGRLDVDTQMQTGIEGVWAAGDNVRVSVDGDHDAMMSCQQAMPQGRQAGENAAASALGRPLGEYKQPLYLTCLDLGSAGALLTCGFERDDVLASGEQAKRFKRYINRSVIYPPKSSDGGALLELGKTKPPRDFVASLQKWALRSDRLRSAVLGRAEDHADRYSVQPVPPKAPAAR